MMTASDATKKSYEVLRNHETEELKKIDNLIEEAVYKGETRCSYEGNLHPNTRMELERLGYRLTIGSQYNQDYVIINWGKA